MITGLSDVFTTQELVAVASTYSTIVHDEGEIVKTWRDKVGGKYTKLPGIRALHDFLIVRDPATNNAIMKVHEQCYKDAFKETSMKIISGHLANVRVIPSCEDTYKQRGKVGEISPVKAAHLQQMYANYVRCML